MKKEKPPSDQFVRVVVEILDSSIAENYELRHFFEDMLKLADWRTGIVDMPPEAIRRRINLPLKKVLWGLAELEKPDAKDRSGVLEGRRIVLIAPPRKWGWLIVNYEAYRVIRTKEERREYCRLGMAAWRAKKKAEEAAVVLKNGKPLPGEPIGNGEIHGDPGADAERQLSEKQASRAEDEGRGA